MGLLKRRPAVPVPAGQQATDQEVLLTGLGWTDSRSHAPGESATLCDIVALAKWVLAYLAAEFCPELCPEAITPEKDFVRCRP
ncbi:hypothetical protein ACRAVF_30145 [Bradyrhizobium oligotrophicum S58]